jgi:hypothetical protein
MILTGGYCVWSYGGMILIGGTGYGAMVEWHWQGNIVYAAMVKWYWQGETEYGAMVEWYWQEETGYGAMVEWYWQVETKRLREKCVAEVVCSPQIPQRLVLDRT